MANVNKNKIIKYLILVLGCLNINIVFADDFYSNHAIGWHWYNDPIPEKKIDKKQEPFRSKDPSEQMAMARKKIKNSLDNAIINPTPDNIRNYIALQNELNEHSQKFSDNWQYVLLNNPQLNFSLNHPTNNVALQVYKEQQSQLKDSALKIFAEETGLFFFYKSTCPYCQRFAPILKSFAASNGLTIIPITLDGIALPEFPNSLVDHGQAAQFQVTVTPSLFAVNPHTRKAYPIAYGLTSETELRDNIYRIMKREGKN